MNNLPDTPEPGGIVTINMPCQFGYLRIARQSVMDFCARANLTEYKSAQLEMAVDEACSNIIEHSYGGEVDFTDEENGTHPGLQINLRHLADRVIVEICDFGEGFDYNEDAIISPDEYLSTMRDRGLGMYIIKNFVDEMTYIKGEKGKSNCLRLTKMV